MRRPGRDRARAPEPAVEPWGARARPAWQDRGVSRDPGSSYASETRQMVRRERLRLEGGGPPGLLVLVVIILVSAAVIWVSVR